MKTLLPLLLLSSLVLFFTACQPADPGESREALLEGMEFPLGDRHHSTGMGLSYRIPEGWHINRALGIPGGLIVGPETNDITPNIRVIRDRLGPYSQNRFIRSFTESYFLRFEQFREISRGELTTDAGVTVKRIEVQSRSQVGMVRQVVYFFFRGGEAFALIGSAPPSHATYFGAYFDEVARTFQWEGEPTSPPPEEEPLPSDPVLPEEPVQP